MNTLNVTIHHANEDISTKQVEVANDITTLDEIRLTDIATTYTNVYIEDIERHVEFITFEFKGEQCKYIPRYKYDW